MNTSIRKSISFILAILITFFVHAQSTNDTTIAPSLNDTMPRSRCFTTVAEGREIIPLIPATNFSKILEGRVMGIQATNGGGQPGSAASVIVRGSSSVVNDNAPVIILDGMLYLGDINAINLSDIASITVLKDAVAAMRYGSRSAGGIIQIVTKKGSSRKPSVTLSARAGVVNRAFSDYKTIRSEQEYYEISWDAFRNHLISAGYSPEQAGQWASGPEGVVNRLGYNVYDIPNELLLDPVTGKLNPAAKLRYSDGDWREAMQRTALRHEYYGSLSAGGKKGSYYLSGGYMNEGGYIRNTGYERFTSRFNGTLTPLPWLKSGLNASFGLGTQQFTEQANINNPFYISRAAPPIYPVHYYNNAGAREPDPITGSDKYDWGDTSRFPNSSIGNRSLNRGRNAVGALDLDQHTARSSNWTIAPYVEVTLFRQLKLNTTLGYLRYNLDSNRTYNADYSYIPGGQFYNSESLQKLLQMTYSLAWERLLGQHKINLGAGYESFNRAYGSAAQLAISGQPLSGSKSRINGLKTRAHFVNADYNFAERYYLTAGIRRDKSNYLAHFTPHQGFWSTGAAWSIKNEKFLQDVRWLNGLKIKSSYGKQGYMYQRAMAWEEDAYMYQWNIGFELSLLDSRISLEAEYFDKKHQNLLLPSVPNLIPFPYYHKGLELQNQGFEGTLRVVPLSNQTIQWESTIRLSAYKNRILALPQLPHLRPEYRIWEKGNSIYDFYLVEHAGVDPANGDELYYYTNESGGQSDTSDYAYAVSKNGRKNWGSSLPAAFGSFHNAISYKNFTLSFLFTFGIGGKYYDGVYQELMSGMYDAQNYSRNIKDRWTRENPDGSAPRLEYHNVNIAQPSSRFLFDASYLNWRHISLEYSFTAKQLKKLRMKNLTVYITGDNLMLFAGREGMDPQATFSGNPGYLYSPARTIITGFNIGL